MSCPNNINQYTSNQCDNNQCNNILNQSGNNICPRCNLVISVNKNTPNSDHIYCNHCYLGMIRFIENYDNTHNNINVNQNLTNFTHCPEYYFNNNHTLMATNNGTSIHCYSCGRNYNLNDIRNALTATNEYNNFRQM